MQPYSRPVILLGHGARGCDLIRLLDLGVPILTSWQAKDMVDNDHEWYFGSPGIYGQRMANMVLHHADMIIAVGNRMAIWNVGYEGPRPDQQVIMVDVDAHEVAKFPQAVHIRMTTNQWVNGVMGLSCADSWQDQCKAWRDQYPLVESPTHDDRDGYINSYRFMERLQRFLRPNEIIATDMGTAHICAHQVLRLRPPQRIISSGGLGEMGCGLPAAIGASFATSKGEVLCLAGDGGMMMNLQEMQTIVHHKLPIKIIVFRNDGYLMIKHTQTMARMQQVSVDKDTGVSCPSFRAIAHTLGMAACDVRNWRDFDQAIPLLFMEKGPALVEFHMHPQQPLVPKLDPIYVDGKPTSPRFCDMSPAL